MKFVELLIRAKCNEPDAVMEVERMFLPLIFKYSYINGKFDYELFCLQQERLILCIRLFKI